MSEVEELERRLRDETAMRRRLVDLATVLNSTVNLPELLQAVLDAASELLEAETSSLMLVDEDTRELRIEVATGDIAPSVVGVRVPPGRGVAGWALEHRQPVVVDDPAADERFYQDVESAVGFRTRNLLAVPLLVKDRPVGVVEVINKRGDERGDRRFTEGDVELATALASMAAVALDNATMYARLADALATARMSYRL